MKFCSIEAFARCPLNERCGDFREASFVEGSECDAFNQAVLNRPRTNADRIRSMNNYDLAVFLSKTKALVYRADLPVIAYSTQDMADNLEWLQQLAEV